MDYKNINDYETIYMIRERNEDAYNLMYYKYQPIISKLAKTLINKFQNVGIDYCDLFQEGMYGVCEAIESYNPSRDSVFFSYAVLFARRKMYKLLSSSITNKNSILNFSLSLDNTIYDGDVSLIDIICDDINSLDDFYLKKINDKELLDLKYELKDIYSPVFELKLNGFSNSEIAKLLDLSYKNVDNYLRSIKTTLRKCKKHLHFID